MYAVSVNGMRHFDARNLDEYLGKGYTFLDDDKNPVDDVEKAAQEEIDRHSGTGINMEQLIQQLKTQGIDLEGD